MRTARLPLLAGALAAVLVTTLVALLAGCAAVGIRPLRMPPVTSWSAADTLVVAGRRFHRVQDATFELYAQHPAALPLAEARVRRAVHEFGRHFGGAPAVAVLLFDAPADPEREFDFGPFVERDVQVLAFVRARDDRFGALGVDEPLFDARVAELLLAAYADSVIAARTGRSDARDGRRALDRLPHWFVEAVVSRVASPDAVEQGRAFSRVHRLQLLPLHRLFGLRRRGGMTWSEMAEHVAAAPVAADVQQDARQDARPDASAIAFPALLAAESTAFGEFIVDRLGPTALQAMADELLTGRPTAQVLGDLGGQPMEAPALESAWGAWLGDEGR